MTTAAVLDLSSAPDGIVQEHNATINCRRTTPSRSNHLISFSGNKVYKNSGIDTFSAPNKECHKAIPGGVEDVVVSGAAVTCEVVITASVATGGETTLVVAGAEIAGDSIPEKSSADTGIGDEMC
ncbi:hypothetical protein EJB05_47101 [Eragrostis curvula]|uniref:Uncharacterized protein n=1 Tax=Eragrostis curvula TaxID=38414 RepID=A0A5J9T912_9POAL|nr:hypothetical protein EJB05_47101 [Eragrostis curvula]